jgi:hypothetical protein
LVDYFNADTATFATSFNPNSGNTAMITAVFAVTAVGTGTANTMSITGLTGMTGANGDIFITQLNPTLLTSPALPPVSDMSRRLLALEKRFSEVDLKSDDEENVARVCPCCDTVKLDLPYNGFCSRKCFVHSDSLDTKDNLIHLGEDESFVRVTPKSVTSVFPGIPLSEKDDYISRLSPLWNNVLPIPSTMPNCVDLVCRGRREMSTPHATKV